MSKRGNLSYDDGMMIWKTRDAYRAHTVLLALFYLPQFLFALFAVSHLAQGRWSQAAVYGLAIAGMWGARWLMCTGLPRLVRWGWQALRGRPRLMGLLLVGLLGLSGCAEYSYRMTELYGFNCRPGALQQGQCVAAKGASK